MNIVVNTSDVFLNDLAKRVANNKFSATRTFDLTGALDGYEVKFKGAKGFYAVCLSDSKTRVIISRFYAFGNRDSFTPRESFMYDIAQVQNAGLSMRSVKNSPNKI